MHDGMTRSDPVPVSMARRSPEAAQAGADRAAAAASPLRTAPSSVAG